MISIQQTFISVPVCMTKIQKNTIIANYKHSEDFCQCAWINSEDFYQCASLNTKSIDFSVFMNRVQETSISVHCALVHTFNSEYFHQCTMGNGAYLKIWIFRWVRMPVGKDLSAFMQIINYRHAKSPTEILLQKVCWDAFVLKYGKNNLTTFLVIFFFFKSSFHDILKSANRLIYSL